QRIFSQTLNWTWYSAMMRGGSGNSPVTISRHDARRNLAGQAVYASVENLLGRVHHSPIMMTRHQADTRIPVVLVAGLAGSGKSRWIKRVLTQPGMADSLVIADPVSIAGMGHALVAQVQDDNTPAPEGACLCCTLRQDLVRTLVNALWRFSRNGKRQFRRVFIETGAAADPMAIADALVSVPALERSYRLHEIVTVIDGKAGVESVQADPAGRSQLAAADRLILSEVVESDIDALRAGVPVAD